MYLSTVGQLSNKWEDDIYTAEGTELLSPLLQSSPLAGGVKALGSVLSFGERVKALGSVFWVPLRYFIATQCQLKWTPVTHGFVAWKETFCSLAKTCSHLIFLRL